MVDHPAVLGIHHITAIASGAQANFDFYTRTLGLRLVKRTVNFDAPDTYHFYYGDQLGHPGTLLTFFPFELAAAGRVGTGMAETTSFAIPEDALEPWMLRLAELGHETEGPTVRFDEHILGLRDPDGLMIELVAEPGLKAHFSGEDKSDGPIPAHQIIRRLHSVLLCVEAPERTARLLTETFGYESVGEEAGRQRFRPTSGGPAAIVDVQCRPEQMRGRMGAGTVHHVAFRARDDDEQLKWREEMLALGYNVTPVLDRQYFRSIYFREPGGVLFEIATDPPGFTIDEAPEVLGTALKLPPWLESHRADIERRLPPVNFGTLAHHRKDYD
jgi:glyoxalase family protein